MSHSSPGSDLTTKTLLGVASLAIGLAVGCAAPVNDPGTPLDTSSPKGAHHAPAPPTPPPDETRVALPPAPVAPPAGAAVTCPELGISGAIFCDGFEAPALAATWSPVVEGGEVHPYYAQHAVGGAHSLQAAFDPLPAAGRAALSYRAPFSASTASKPASIAMQFSVYLPKDGYPNVLPLGGLHGASGALTVNLVSSTHLTLTDKLGGASESYTLGAATLGAWQCVEIQIDAKGTLDAWVGKDHAATGSLGAGPAAYASLDAVEVGLTYDEGKNPNASVAAYFDDVVVAPTAVGCLH